MKRWILFFIIGAALGCKQKPPLDFPFRDAAGSTHNLSQYLEENDALALLFLSPECPLCQNYAVAMRELKEAYSAKNIHFSGVISGEFYSKEEVAEYQEQYLLDMEMLFDPEFKLARYYGATTTPEAVLINKDGKLMYRGAIDNWAISLGKKRLEATAHYLRDAIDNYLVGKKIDPKETKPVGCFIE